jgi:hypothetical protein
MDKRILFGGGAAVVVVIAVVLALVLGGGGSNTVRTTTTTTTTNQHASSCPSGQIRGAGGQCVTPTTLPPDLIALIPTYITGNSQDSCTVEGSSQFSDVNADAEALCDLTNNQSAPEDYVIYDRFPDASGEQGYYSTLVSNNGMQTGQGDCSTLTEVATSTGNSNYCETTYSGNHTGNIFVYEGDPGFQLGNNFRVSGQCTNSPSAVAVVGFSDNTDHVVGVAFACGDANSQASLMLNDFHHGNLDIGS